MATTFDGPTGEACLVRRDVSNSPLQALTLLNDPMFVEVARVLGAAAMQAGPGVPVPGQITASDLGRKLPYPSSRSLQR